MSAVNQSFNQNIRFCTAKDSVKLAYAVSGQGSPLVMSATWLTHLEHQWQSLAWRPWLEAFSRGRKLLRYDARGCGLSDRDTDRLSFENWVSDFECVLDAARFRRFDLLATCWGGPIAIDFAARHPERVNRLILYGTFALGRLRWSDRPKEIAKARVLLDLTRLALQLRFSFEVCAARFGLVCAAPERPCDDMSGLDAPLGELDGDAADFLDRPSDQKCLV